MEYKIINVLGKRLVWLPESLMLFDSSELIEEVLSLYDKYDYETILNEVGSEKKENAKKIIETLKELDKEDNKYKNIIREINSDEDLKLSGIELNPAFECNMHCKYCFAEDGSFNKSGRMSQDMAKKVIDFTFEQAKDSDHVCISLIGGEPLVNYKVIQFILEYSKQKGKQLGKKVKFVTTTNGTLLTEDIMKTLDSYNVNTMISCDSHEKEVQNFLRPMAGGQGSYDRVKDLGWKSMLGSKRMSAIRATITPYNLNFFEIAKNYYESGFEHVHVEEVSLDDEEFKFTNEHVEKIKDEYIKLTKYLRDEIIDKNKNLSSKPLFSRMYEIHNRKPRYNYCGAFQNTVGISPQGYIYPCDWLTRDDLCIGDIEQGIDKEKLKDIIKEKIRVPEKCKKCWARNLCGGGCKAKHLLAAEENREIDCDLDLFKFELQLYLYSEIAKYRPEFIDKFIKARKG